MISSLTCTAQHVILTGAPVIGVIYPTTVIYPTAEARAQLCFDPLWVPWEASSCSAPDNHITTEHILMAIFGVKKQWWPITRWFHCLQSLEHTGGFPSGFVKSTGHLPCCNSERLQPTQLSCVSSSTRLAASNPTSLCLSPMGNSTVKASAIPWPRGGRILWDENLLPPLERHHFHHSSQHRPRLVTVGNKTDTNQGRYRGMSSRTLDTSFPLRACKMDIFFLGSPIAYPMLMCWELGWMSSPQTHFPEAPWRTANQPLMITEIINNRLLF